MLQTIWNWSSVTVSSVVVSSIGGFSSTAVASLLVGLHAFMVCFRSLLFYWTSADVEPVSFDFEVPICYSTTEHFPGMVADFENGVDRLKVGTCNDPVIPRRLRSMIMETKDLDLSFLTNELELVLGIQNVLLDASSMRSFLGVSSLAHGNSFSIRFDPCSL